MNRRDHFGTSFRTLALTGLSFAFVAAATLPECSAQTRGGSTTGGSTTGGNTGGGSAAAGTGGATAGAFSGQPGNTQAGEIGRSSDRQFTDTGAAGQGGGRTGGLGGGRGFGGFGGMGGLGGLGGNMFGAGNTASSKPTVRTRLAGPVDIPVEMRAASQFRTQQQVQATAAQRFVRGYSASHQNGVATISGTVGTEKERRMAELLLKLEPGVRRVENQITVSP
jgi:hypothetical protein